MGGELVSVVSADSPVGTARYYPDDGLTLAAKRQQASFLEISTIFKICGNIQSFTLPAMWYTSHMGKSDVYKFLTEIGRRGGQARAKALTAKRRKEIARKAAKAASAARKRKAKARAK